MGVYTCIYTYADMLSAICTQLKLSCGRLRSFSLPVLNLALSLSLSLSLSLCVPTAKTDGSKPFNGAQTGITYCWGPVTNRAWAASIMFASYGEPGFRPVGLKQTVRVGLGHTHFWGDGKPQHILTGITIFLY